MKVRHPNPGTPLERPALEPESAAALVVSGLDAYYGSAHVLHALTCAIDGGSVAIVGRNGMGKSTLCRAIVGMAPPRVTGSISLGGREILGLKPHRICRAGVAYVPQGRRVFPSLTAHEHLLMIDPALRRRGPWDIDAVYDLFPRLAQRRTNGGAQLSGGEQQMLAIGRALLTNPRLLLMDEPSEGLAPSIVENLVDAIVTLARGGMTVVTVEQNLAMAMAVAQRLWIMVSGQIAVETTASVLAEDHDAQRRYLGVETTGR